MRMPETVAARAPQHLRVRAGKYALVSVVAVVASQIVLIVSHGVLHWEAVWANFAAVSVGCIPSYTLNRYWVWGKRGRNHLMKEVVPFWGLALVGLLFSTVLVAVADRWSDASIVIVGANLCAFGILWVVKFAVFDSLMFGEARR